MTDEKIVARVVSGKQDEYAELMSRYQEALMRYAIRLVHDHDVASDVVQQAFIKAYVNLNGFNTKLKFSSWLYRIAHNEAVNALKKHARELHPDEEWFDNLADERVGIEEELELQADKDIVTQAIDHLPNKYREVVILHFLEHKKYEEISDILQIPTSTVGVRLSRAKARLKELLTSPPAKLQTERRSG